ncbi:uncharacterized protein LOC126904993 [Daktulosphaira vitifoliae]|uniref:uncharacterized protein LOC126904993 n=1 Tax=Daktulosphaira vitifoliae TaxID=58002 RepID=UPI0021AABCCF|nr:uncharacterized protein LOC126904993 [Daktulosphaira vitifoliae]
MPSEGIADDIAAKYDNLALADPSFAVPNNVDLLLGADLFARILDGNRVSVGESLPVAFGSVFGWILIGPVPQTNDYTEVSCPISLVSSVENIISKFWQIEEPEAAPDDFTHAGLCETMYIEKSSRDVYGRFVVPLFFCQPVADDTFYGSRTVAVRRFTFLEKKLQTDRQLRESYCAFMAEYLALGHMSLATSKGLYFIPHHAVYKHSEGDIKLRVVFDASAQAFSGTSLNQCLYAGPKLQRDVIDVLTLFRLSRFAFTADINKMYRQILMLPEHRCYQHILWRASPHDELREYQLNTVTYGVNCSPFTAIRVLYNIAEQYCGEFPAVRDALLFSTYVDDICVGGDTVEEALKLQSELITVLGRAGMVLKKWASNTEVVLNNVSPDDRVIGMLPFDDHDAMGTKVLGLQWDHCRDTFYYHVQAVPATTTKRDSISYFKYCTYIVLETSCIKF